MPDSPIRWVIFDAVGTLIEPTPSVATVYTTIAKQYGSLIDEEIVRERFRDTMNARLSDQTDEAMEYDFWQRTVAEVIGPTNDDRRCFEELYEHFAKPSSWRLKTGAQECVSALVSSGIQLGVASNFDSRLHGILDSVDLLQQLKLRLISSEIGWRKPARQFYERVLTDTGVEPSKHLMVGDDHDKDILPARQLGMRTFHVSESSSEAAAGSLFQLTDWLRNIDED
ncbi:MAG: HAD-IA family hydrolase [Planctomycetaceae bacterium]|nr:HAD-IA family hydrolase [Planctomycetaceae bacterium]